MSVNKFKYYRVTQFIKNAKQLEVWLDHFKATGAPAALISHDDGKYYSIWRAGKEAGNTQDLLNDEELRGKIVTECHGFSEAVFTTR